MADNILTVEGLSIAFAMHGHMNEVVKNVSFRIPAGKTVALVGESGSGKSVISQSIMGLLPRAGSVTAGRILFTDSSAETAGAEPKIIDIATLPRDGEEIRDLRGLHIGMIFQEPMSSLSPVHTIGNQIEEALQLHRPVAKDKARAKTEEMLSLVGFKDPHASYDKYSFELSGGLRQRAMLAMALICRPALLIADEPTTALDVTIQAQVLDLMRSLQREFGMAILLITHDLGIVANMADEVVVIYHGQIMEAGAVEDIFRNPRHPYLKALIRALPQFDMKPGERLVALRDINQDLSGLIGKRSANVLTDKDDILLSARNLRKTYGSRKASWFDKKGSVGVVAVDDVSFDIKRGECLGLVGESGSGKTTISKLIMRAVTPDSGSILFNCQDEGDIDILALDEEKLRDFRPRMQMIFQDPVSSLSPRMTTLNIIREPMEIHGDGTADEQTKRVTELMAAVGLDPRFLNRYPHSFSGGQRQRIGIARALALNPELIVCDEPVSALDVSVQAQILNLLKDLQTELGLTYLFISHNLAVVDYMADRIAVMAHGRIVEIAPRQQLFREPVHPYTRALLKAVPFADLDRPLDFAHLARGSASDMRLWPAAFVGDQGGPGLQPRSRRGTFRPRAGIGRHEGTARMNGAAGRAILARASLAFALLALAVASLPRVDAATQTAETPFFAKAVEKKELPPVNERLPASPRIIDLRANGKGPSGSPWRHAPPADGRSARYPHDDDLRLYAADDLQSTKLEIVPDVLEKIDEQDGRIFTLHLRKGHKWSTGICSRPMISATGGRTSPTTSAYRPAALPRH